MTTDRAPQLRQVRAAVVGPGVIGRVHADAIRRVGASVRVVVARSASGAAEVREQFGAERVTTDFALVLSDPEIDVVHICTPNVLHFPMARAALAAGKHVVLEKPLTLTVQEGRDLLRMAEASGRVHAVCFNTRFYPLVQEIHERVRRGDLGDLVSARASVLEDGLLEASDWNWRLDPELGGPSVALSTIGCHLIDLITFMVGDTISEVSADLRTVHPRRRGPTGDREVEVDGQEMAHLMVRFSRGARGLLAISQASAGRRYDYSVQLDGTRQALAWQAPDSNELWIGKRGSPNQIVLRDSALLTPRGREYMEYGAGAREGFGETFKQLVTHAYAAVAGNAPPASGDAMYPTFHDGLAALCVHAAALESGRSGRWEEVPRVLAA
jgi:predicted dehydrogenase